jgi:alpha-beta hydrolase superfamily lysophospholipase
MVADPKFFVCRAACRATFAFRLLEGGVWAFIVLVGIAAPLAAQEEKKAPAEKDEAADEQPQPFDITGNELVTQDGVVLKASFFPGSKGKDSVPIILLHSWKGDRREFATLAPQLHKAGHAVLVPDLRGHGQSRQYVGGGSRELDASKFVPADFALMATSDMETLKGYLLKRNNAGELNLEKLCVVGGEMGASVAFNWALIDWSWPIYPGLKQGQYVKALVLLSPQRNFKGLNITAPLNSPLLNAGVSIMLLVGNEDPKLLAEVQRMHATLEKLHKAPAVGQEATEQTLFFKGLDTKVQGTKLLGVRGLNVEQRIKKFIDLRLTARDYPWMESGKKPSSASGK